MKPLILAGLRALILLVPTLLVPTPAEAYEVVPVPDGGTVSGRVTVDPARAHVETFTIAKDPHVCGAGLRDVPMVVVDEDGALLEAVVYLDGVERGKAYPTGVRKITLNQEACYFEPRLSVMINDGEIEAVNSDQTLHNIHVYELIGRARRTVLNVSQPEKGNIVTKRISLRRGAGMKIECDAHDFMHAFVFVARNPYYAVVGQDGRFTITDVPPGRYVVRAWHGVLGEISGKVEVKAGGAAKIDLAF